MNITLETSLLNCKKEIFEKKFEVFPKEICIYASSTSMKSWKQKLSGRVLNLHLCINPIKMSKFL